MKKTTKEYLDANRLEIHFDSGEKIYKQGFFPNGIFCLDKGKVMTTKMGDSGNSLMTNLYKGIAYLGLEDFVLKKPYANTCIALEGSRLYFHKATVISDVMEYDCALPKNMLLYVSGQIGHYTERLVLLTQKNMAARLAHTLLEIADTFGVDDDGFLNVRLKRSHIAEMSCISVSNTIRNLSIFSKDGFIDLQKKKIRIRDKRRLLNCVEAG
ncbi:MAG: Crp/Fnr family transcriptional regulator [Flavobacteriaceae bacterium]